MLKTKQKHIGYGIIIYVIINSILVIPLLQFSLNTSNTHLDTIKPQASGVSHYSIGYSVTYEVLVNFSLTNVNAIGSYEFKWSRFDDRQPNASLTPNVPPYQESELLYNSITSDGIGLSIDWGHIDKFNNTFDNASVTLANGDSVWINQKYNITLNEISFSGITTSDIGSYPSPPDDLYDLFNVTETFYECNDTDLIALSNSLVDPGDNEIVKAQKIIEGVKNELTYVAQPSTPTDNGEKGADWAEENNEGDCSEYSDLMITLLRIQNIPARKVGGIVITNDGTYEPTVGSTWTLEDGANGHAWVEYYVPNIGWIVSDPTWHEVHNYFNRIDCLHLTENVGAWFSSPAGGLANEQGIPSFAYPLGHTPTWDLQITITIVASNYVPFDWTFIITIAIIIGVVALVALVIYVVIKKTR